MSFPDDVEKTREADDYFKDTLMKISWNRNSHVSERLQSVESFIVIVSESVSLQQTTHVTCCPATADSFSKNISTVEDCCSVRRLHEIVTKDTEFDLVVISSIR